MLGEELVHIALDNAGFAHAQLADHQHLEEVLPALGHAAARSFPAGHARPSSRALRWRGRAAGTAALPLLNFTSQQLSSNFPAGPGKTERDGGWEGAGNLGHHLTAVTGRGNSAGL